MSILFESSKIGNFEIKNRFIRSATYYALSDMDGFISDESVELMKTLAKNDAGLIITGYAYVQKDGQVFPDQNGIHLDAHIPAYQKMTRAVHDLGGKIVMQIAHGGAGSTFSAKSGNGYLAVSITDKLTDYGTDPVEMRDDNIEAIIAAFGKAARRVQEAGFDGVQVHGAHGYLGSQFLSPQSNLRMDKWGGSLENRMRFLLEVTRSMKDHVDNDFPLMIKLGCHDYLDGESELTAEESTRVAAALEAEGICHIEVSHGYLSKSRRKLMMGITSPEQEAPLLPDVRVIREATSCPLAIVAGMRSLAVMEEIVNSGAADHVSLCRPFIREPGLIKRWKDGNEPPAECISCGGCFNPGPDGKLAIFCRQLKKK